MEKAKHVASPKKNHKSKKDINRIFINAIKQKKTAMLKRLFECGVKIEPLNDANQTGIHIAVENKCWSVIDLLFSYSNNEINYVDNTGLTHFHIACMAGNLEAARHLIHGGVDVNIPLNSNSHKYKDFTPLHFAVKYTRLEMVELLLDNGADANAADYKGRTPLHLACSMPEVTDHLYNVVRHLVIPICSADNEYTRIVDIQHKLLDIARLLVQRGANVNARDITNNTPPFYTLRDDISEELNGIFTGRFANTVAGGKIFTKKNKTWINQLRDVQKRKFALLLERNADVCACNDSGDTVLHCAVANLRGLRQLSAFAEPYFDDSINVDVVELIVKNRGDVNAMNKTEETPLQIAVSLLSIEIVNALLRYKANVDNIKFDHEDGHCFYYPNVLPSLEATENLMDIVNVLSKEGFRSSQKDDLAILKFLIGNNLNYPYITSKIPNVVYYALTNVLELGTEDNIEHALEKFSTCEIIKCMISHEVDKYLIKLEGKLIISRNIENCLARRIVSITRISLNRINEGTSNRYFEEADRLKVAMLNENKCLSDFVDTHPDSCFKCHNYREILRSADFEEQFPHYAGVVKGYVAKHLVRGYVVKATNDYVRSLIGVGLDDSCCERISYYLVNEDLWNLCLASTIELPNEEASYQKVEESADCIE